MCVWLSICLYILCLCVLVVGYFFFHFSSTNVHLCVHILLWATFVYFISFFVLSHRGEFDSHRVIIILWLFHDTKCYQTKQQ